MMIISSILGGLSSVFQTILGPVIEWWKARKAMRLAEEKQKAELSIPLNEQALNIFKEIVSTLRDDIKKMQDTLHFQDKSLLECRERGIEMKVALDSCRAENNRLTAECERLKGECDRLMKLAGQK